LAHLPVPFLLPVPVPCSTIVFLFAPTNINFSGVARNTTDNNDINTSKLAEILEDKPSKTLVDFVDNTTQAKKPKENENTIIEIDLQNKVDMAKKH
jgi:hypothetical protein